MHVLGKIELDAAAGRGRPWQGSSPLPRAAALWRGRQAPAGRRHDQTGWSIVPPLCRATPLLSSHSSSSTRPGRPAASSAAPA